MHCNCYAITAASARPLLCDTLDGIGSCCVLALFFSFFVFVFDDVAVHNTDEFGGSLF